MADPESLFRYVRLNSKNRVYGTNSNFTIDLSQDQTTHRVNEVHIMSASLIHNFYNITSKTNTLICFSNGQGTKTISVTPGQYTITQLMDAIKAAIDVAYSPSVFSYTIDPITNLVSWSITLEPLFRIYTVDTVPTSTMAPKIGYTIQAALAPSGTFDSTPALNGIEHVYIQSSRINNSGNIKSQRGTFDSTFLSIPVKVPYGTLITYQAQADHQEQITYNAPRDLSTIDIIISDDDGNELDVGNNHEVVIILKFFYIP